MQKVLQTRLFCFIKNRLRGFGATGLLFEAVHTRLVEGADGISRRLHRTADRFGDRFGGLSVCAGADNLRSSQGKSVGGTQGVLNVLTLGLRQSANINWGFHALILLHKSALHKRSHGIALDNTSFSVVRLITIVKIPSGRQEKH